jgi:hypothetical protein
LTDNGAEEEHILLPDEQAEMAKSWQIESTDNCWKELLLKVSQIILFKFESGYEADV